MYYEMAPMEGITTYIYRRAHFHYFGEIDRYYTPFISTHKDKVRVTRNYRRFCRNIMKECR